MKKNAVISITRTAAMIAVLIVIQFITKSMGQYVTGSLVNLILAVSALTIGLVEGIVVAAISPFLAFAFGIGPAFIQIVPFVAIGNAVLVAVLWLFSGKEKAFDKKAIIKGYAGAVVSSVAKFAALWLGVTKIALNLVPNIKAPQVEKISAMFTWPQLATALIGTVLAITIVPQIKKAIGRPKQ